MARWHEEKEALSAWHCHAGQKSLSFTFGRFGTPREAVDGVVSEGLFQSVKVREIIRMIEADGWYLDRTRGSHRQYKPAARGAYGIVEVDPIVGRLLL